MWFELKSTTPLIRVPASALQCQMGVPIKTFDRKCDNGDKPIVNFKQTLSVQTPWMASVGGVVQLLGRQCELCTLSLIRTCHETQSHNYTSFRVSSSFYFLLFYILKHGSAKRLTITSSVEVYSLWLNCRSFDTRCQPKSADLYSTSSNPHLSHLNPNLRQQ